MTEIVMMDNGSLSVLNISQCPTATEEELIGLEQVCCLFVFMFVCFFVCLFAILFAVCLFVCLLVSLFVG